MASCCQPRVQLAVTDVDRIDARRAALEQHLREAAGRRADIERDDAGHGKAEMIECGDQLHGSARDVVARARDRRIAAPAATPALGLGLDHAADLDQPAADEVLGAGARGHKPQLDQDEIEARPAAYAVLAIASLTYI